MDWISVSEKLPEGKQEVSIVIENNGRRVSLNAVWDGERFAFFGNPKGEEHWYIVPVLNLVLYWMPVAEPPKS